MSDLKKVAEELVDAMGHYPADWRDNHPSSAKDKKRDRDGDVEQAHAALQRVKREAKKDVLDKIHKHIGSGLSNPSVECEITGQKIQLEYETQLAVRNEQQAERIGKLETAKSELLKAAVRLQGFCAQYAPKRSDVVSSRIIHKYANPESEGD